MSFKIFISYSSKDKDHAIKVRNNIENDYVHIFVADSSLNFGKNIPEGIENAINQCDLFIVLWSKNAKDSNWVQQEIGMAKGKQKPILPLVLNKNLALPAFIKELKFLPLHTNPHDAYRSLQNHILQEAQKINRDANDLFFNDQSTKKEFKDLKLLGNREKQVLDWLSKGLLYKEIADRMGITVGTVRQHIHNIYKKLHVQNRTEAINRYYGR